MKLFLKNIGKIKDANIEIKGITVIAGENNSGKSTVGKTLFSVFNSFHNIDMEVYRVRIQSIENLLDLLYRETTNRLTSRVDTEEIAENIVSNIDVYKTNKELLEEFVISSILQYDTHFSNFNYKSSLTDIITRIVEVLEVSNEDVFKVVLEKKLEAEFYGQISNLFTDEIGEITLQIKDENIEIIIEKNNVKSINKQIDLHAEAIYLDDPFVLDEHRIYRPYRYGLNYMDHKTHLKHKLFSYDRRNNVIEEIVINNKFSKIYEKINSVCNGNIVKSRNEGFGYKNVNTEKVLDIRNLSTGLKTFVILKTLLVNGAIEYNGTIILDEPEIHLHPEWQLIFAELIVLIQKEFGMHILVNTHSPYFLNAIEVYSVKHGIDEKCKYYLATINNEYSGLEDATTNIEKIYSKLARPLQELENVRYIND